MSFGRLIAAGATTGYNTSFFVALDFNKVLGATNGIDAVLTKHKLDAFVLPVLGLVMSASGTPFGPKIGTLTELAAIAGYPVVTGADEQVQYI